MADVEWDPENAAAEVTKHGVDFADAATVLPDKAAITVKVESVGEQRFVTIGMDALARVLVVVSPGARIDHD